jgi:thiamine biosynthesis lipoprotein
MAKLLLLLSLFLLLSCKKEGSGVVKNSRFFRMSTITELKLYSHEIPKKEFETLSDSIFKRVDSLLLSYEKRFSSELFNSEVSLFNRRDVDTLEVSSSFYKMVESANLYSEKLDGSFDVSVLPLKKYWKPSSTKNSLPTIKGTESQKDVDSILKFVDYKKIELLDSNKIFVADSRLKIDLGGVAKGVVIEEVSALIKSSGVDNFLINSGGDIFVSGTKNSGDKFRVGIKDPKVSGNLIKIVEVVSGAVVTSGDYERFRVDENGDRVHHLFDTETGFPSTQNSSVTVIANSPAIADILSTGLFSKNALEAVEIINELDSVHCFIVDVNGNEFSSKGFTSVD